MAVGYLAEVVVSNSGPTGEFPRVGDSELFEVFECSHDAEDTKKLSDVQAPGSLNGGMPMSRKPYHRAAMTTITAIRRANFELLWKEFSEECEKEGRKPLLIDFAEHYGLSEKHASQLRNGSKGIGHRTARRMEQHHTPKALPEGWMDQDHSRNHLALSPSQQAMVDLFAHLLQDNPQRASELLLQIVKAGKKK